MQQHSDEIKDFLLHKLRGIASERKERLSRIGNAEQFSAWQQEFKEKLRTAYRMPLEKSNLSPQVTGILDGEGFHVEKIFFHSCPRFPVTANLYIPEGAENAPAVLFFAGDTPDGKASVNCRETALHLVAHGFMVLAVDLLCAGERGQLTDSLQGEPPSRHLAFERDMISRQMRLAGEDYSFWSLRDAVRSYDYLESRPEVDPGHIFLAGDDSGSELCTFFAAVDDRPFALASGTLSAMLHRTERQGISGAGSLPFYLSGTGYDPVDLLLANVPRPLLLSVPEDAAEICDEIRAFYELPGKDGKIEFFTPADGSNCEMKKRNALCRFFARQLTPSPTEINAVPGLFPAAELQVTPTGETAHLDGKLLIIDFIRLLADDFRVDRPKLSCDELRVKVREMLRLDEKKIFLPECRELPGSCQYSTHFSRFSLEINGNRHIVLHAVHPAGKAHNGGPLSAAHAVLYIPRSDTEKEMAEYDFHEADGIFGIDSGSTAETCRSPLEGGTDELRLRCRVQDIISTIKLLKHHGCRQLDIIAAGNGSVPAVFAALLSDAADNITLLEPPESFDSMLRTRVTDFPGALIPPGVLKFTDLPELIEAVGANIVK